MKTGRGTLGLILLMMFGSCRVPRLGAQDKDSADLILRNARIQTPRGWVSALAVRRGVIVALGDEPSVRSHRSARTRTIDLGGHVVLPGLHDMHVHPILAGLEQISCRIEHGSTPPETFDAVAVCVERSTSGEWITGRAYDADSFGDTPPVKEMLDRVAPENPVMLADISGHSAWVSSQALALAEIDRDTPDPDGGIIEHDSNGEPTGILREAAMGLVSSLVPEPSREQNASALGWALDRMLENGITALVDASTSEAEAQAYADLADRGELLQRVRGCLWAEEDELIARRNTYLRARFAPDCVKIFLDGVPTDAHTAAMMEDYIPIEGQDRQGRERGMLLVPSDALEEQVARYDGMGLTVKFHSAGDRAVRQGIDAIEAARKANGFTGKLHSVGHDSFVQMTDIHRARALGATLEFSPYIWSPSPIIEDIRKAVGEARMRRFIPIRDALDAGAHTVVGSDWPVVPFVNPWIAIETMVTRQVPGGGGETLAPDQRISLSEAIDLFTIEAARQLNAASYTGSIETGKLADFVVIDRDVFDVPTTEIHKTRVLRTFIDGEEVYRAEQ